MAVLSACLVFNTFGYENIRIAIPPTVFMIACTVVNAKTADPAKAIGATASPGIDSENITNIFRERTLIVFTLPTSYSARYSVLHPADSCHIRIRDLSWARMASI